ncbi:hypothetical protein [Moorena sp. SIO3I6]|uniref:phosphorylase family protein n=1 Tax=Moorena sp. SIO3I6 TaxID=2607831 RepID=UPI0013F93D81|nr:hypothetical protein [Moorena sp. SIO3I6]NEP27924.1 5'-methylthioadenosine/S-adenosylhomocysteine nucleosidase [Moorena sp. SIO3I6]
MKNTGLFSDLPPDDIIQLEDSLLNIFSNIDGIAGRKGLLIKAGVDKYFINRLNFNSNINEFITSLVSQFKDYRGSSQKEYHPLVSFLDYILKEPPQKYNLDDQDLEIFTKLQTGSGIKAPSSTTIDILIITALKDELDALKNCDNQSGKTWQELKDSSDYPYYQTTLTHSNGTQLTIVAAHPVEMGEYYTNNLATRLVSELKPRCLGMTGVCAGNKEKTFLGDVVVANRVFKFDYGKLVASYENQHGKQIITEEIFHDIRTYNLKGQWDITIQNFPEDWLNTIQIPRPKSYYHQERWLLHKLYDYQQQPDCYHSPQSHPERRTECPDWREVRKRLIEKDLLESDGLGLTEQAIKEINNERLDYLEEEHYKDPLNPQIKIGVIATTSKVQKDPKLFERLEKLQRKALGVEMEGAAIGAVAEIHEIPMIVVKGVQDYADYDKNDQFRHYAAEVSARFLLAFFTT